MQKLLFFVMLFLGMMPFSFAQRIDNMAAFRQIPSDKYFRINFENDFFVKTDYYYSQGINLEFVNPALKKNPLNMLLIRLRDADMKFGLAAEHNAFTPTDIVIREIMYGDRPYAATLTLKMFIISTNIAKSSRLSSGLDIGILGPGAFGKEMQTAIHRWTDNYLPLGWGNQVRNDLILNYRLNHEKRLFDVGNFVGMNTNTQLRIGTLSNKVQAGVTLMAGKYISPFESNESNKRFQCYLYAQPLASLVAYDATLQGGLFNQHSPYTISHKDISRITYEMNIGAILQVHRFHLEAFVSMLTKEFDTGKMHRWAGVKLGVSM